MKATGSKEDDHTSTITDDLKEVSLKVVQKYFNAITRSQVSIQKYSGNCKMLKDNSIRFHCNKDKST
jgi:hypothetical protein